MKNLFSAAQGVLSISFIAVNTLFWSALLFPVALFKIIIPARAWRKWWGQVANHIAENWTLINNLAIGLSRRVDIQVEGIEKLNRKRWYLVLSNHQSWVDIPILQKVFYRKIPAIKFFLKQELIKVPVLGLAWWALDFPFMKRYSKDFLKAHPHLKGKDVEITRKACEKFKHMPVSMLNFVEGTRFTPEKHAKQRSPYRHLLRPKAGGVGFVMSAMGDQLESVLDVTICYPNGRADFWSFLTGNVKRVVVKVDERPITDEIRGNYIEDREFRVRFQSWLNDLWTQKDETLETFLSDTKTKE